MENKICNTCGLTKPLTEFYKHPEAKDRFSGKCKDCTRKYRKERYNRILKDPILLELKKKARKEEYRKALEDPLWVESERKRLREKYYRLGSSDKSSPQRRRERAKQYRDKYPEKIVAVRVSQKIPRPKGTERHHWSYRTENAKDLIFLTREEHHKLHRYIIYDQEQMMYRGLDGVLLDTKERHLQYYETLKDKP